MKHLTILLKRLQRLLTTRKGGVSASDDLPEGWVLSLADKLGLLDHHSELMLWMLGKYRGQIPIPQLLQLFDDFYADRLRRIIIGGAVSRESLISLQQALQQYIATRSKTEKHHHTDEKDITGHQSPSGRKPRRGTEDFNSDHP